uniref:Uncharacterized protein n=1 Tax=Knipowitschia caucasica TaxID=637954 RepID=A0AAV2JTF9_KNICA
MAVFDQSDSAADEDEDDDDDGRLQLRLEQKPKIQIEPEGRAVEILSQTDGLKETSSGEPSTIHPDAPHGSGSAPSER